MDIEAGCASGAAALSLAAGAIRSGERDCVLVFGMEKMPKGMIRSSFFEPWQEQAGLTPAPAYFALRAQRLMREAGLTKDDFAAVVVKNRRNGVGNEHAMFRKPVTADDVLASRVVCEPLHLWMLCSPNEGAAAVVLQRGDSGVQLRAACLRSHLPGSVLAESTPMAGIDDRDITPPSALVAADAYAIAGVGPNDIDVVECQDTDAARELLAYEELGLCARAIRRSCFDRGTSTWADAVRQPERRAAVEGRAARRVSRRPSGRTRAPIAGSRRPRQVDGARTGLAHTVGRGANASVVILSR